MSQNLIRGGYSDDSCAIILLVGRTNAGKSTFIKDFTGKPNEWDTGPEDSEKKWLISRTVQQRYWSPDDPLHGYLFVELPCFTDNFVSNWVVLLRVAHALKQLRDSQNSSLRRDGSVTFVAGTVYLHDFSNSDAAGDATADINNLTAQLRLVSPILGRGCLQSSIPVLSKVQEVDDGRERGIKDKWNDFFAGTKNIIKLYRNKDDPPSIVKDLLDCPEAIISLMNELEAGKNIMLKNTAVGKRYRKELEGKIDELEKSKKKKGIMALMERWTSGEEMTQEEQELRNLLKVWKDCHFPKECTKETGSKVCRGRCQKRLYCSYRLDCRCGTHVGSGF
ncbi:hypothetical protein F5883DRAFT_573357 [Diaporthe sp. PMI_573]|nr:hypothetical protein F5883DRAFT_573357 [Diaporthaceae sp. PMI_573]